MLARVCVIAQLGIRDDQGRGGAVKKQWVWSGGVIFCVAALLAIFADDLVSLFVRLMNMEPATERDLVIVTRIVSLLSALIGLAFQIRAWLKRDQPDSAELFKNYYSKLSASCERIDLSLLQLHERGRGIKLPRIYQEMDAVPYGHSAQPETQDSPRELREQRKPLTTWCADPAYRRVVVLGDAGFGKSMFAEALTWRIAQTHLGKTQVEDDTLPELFKRRHVLRLRLRAVAVQCARNELSPQNLLQDAMRQSVVELLGEADGKAAWEGLAEPLLREGIIILDGLDEVPESEDLRKKLLDAIEELAAQLGAQARLIVSSRPYVFEAEHAHGLAGFGVLRLQGMNDGQMEAFIRHWYELTASHDRRNPEASQQDAQALYREIEGRDYLQEPARSPMILTLLVALHLSNIRLPESRAKLYEAAIDLMLDHWTQRAKREDGDYPLEEYEQRALKSLEGNQRKTLLANLALAAHREKTLLISRRQILALFSEHLPDDCNATNLLDFVRYRSGLLKAGEGGDFEFYHRSFQAYLAARALTDVDDWQDEINRLLEEDMDWWQEVYFLLIGAQIHGAGKAAAVPLMRRYVLPCPEDEKPYAQEKWPFLALAARALVEQQVALRGYREVPYLELMRDVLAHLLRIVQKEYALPVAQRAEAGRLLGELGDPRPGVGVKDGLPDIDWVEIPAGEFSMGSGDDDSDAHDDEKPVHKVRIEKSFSMGRYPVTNAQFACFVQAGGYEDERYWRSSQASLAWWRGEPADLSLLDDMPELKEKYEAWLAQEKTRREPRFWRERAWNLANHPVVGVSWYEALAYCSWLSERYAELGLSGRVRLPNEAEWEYAARGDQGLAYAWGDTADPGQGNCADTQLKATSAVGLFPPGPAFELCDLSGNVCEWTSSQWGKSIQSPDFIYAGWAAQDGAQRSGQRDYLDEHALRVVRGGAWNSYAHYACCAFRGRALPSTRFDDLGFRCCLVE